MTDERFNELVNGPLGHPLPMFRYTRALLALRYLVETCPGAEEQFQKYCAEREAQDREQAS